MKLHERYFLVEKVGTQLTKVLLDAQQEHNLTYAEIFTILAEILASKARFCLRAERHPEEPGKGGDEA